MKNNKAGLTVKYLKTGGYSVLISCVAIALVIVINLFVNKLPVSLTQIDSSSSNIFTIGEKTVEIVKGIKEDVTVYYVAQHGDENSYITTLLEKYKELNEKIKPEQIDPALNPGFFKGDYEQVSEGSLIVKSEKRSKIITELEIFYPGVSQSEIYSYYYQYGSLPSSTGFDFENCMTSALNYVTTDVLPVVYNLQGHGEAELSGKYAGYLESDSIEIKELNILSLQSVPEDCDCLFINCPQKDISTDEADMILAYLKSGGKMMYISNFVYTIDEDQENLSSVMEYYGLKKVEGIIAEGDSNARLSNNPFYIIPSYSSHQITDPLTKYYMITTYDQGISISEDLREGLNVSPLLTTSDKSYSKTNYESQTADKEEGDIEGPFNIAVAVNETNENGTQTQIVWINTPTVIDQTVDVYNTGGALFVNSFDWMCEKEDSISIPVKDFEYNNLELNEAQGNFLTIIFAIVLPLAAIVTGLVVWIRRRSK